MEGKKKVEHRKREVASERQHWKRGNNRERERERERNETKTVNSPLQRCTVQERAWRGFENLNDNSNNETQFKKTPSERFGRH
eukprot:CAMPEP_0174231234 /NCGR_PEP_ID=MMETSP0417-20130205/1805_1 /TAXON_ID=242541 /ORGANISM="Mayorella sp, Strain BSH-02190019" /LENGTH=82 /DNA_ID=CAMNT_0015309079 /DNA_START=51 /DNA_END=299 /DNA_ORIENTATION=-